MWPPSSRGGKGEGGGVDLLHLFDDGTFARFSGTWQTKHKCKLVPWNLIHLIMQGWEGGRGGWRGDFDDSQNSRFIGIPGRE